MLNGGVFTSMALSWASFKRFFDYKPTTNSVFTATEDLAAGGEGTMHAVFCYGWWDNPQNAGDGYWVCKNRCDRYGTTHSSRRYLARELNSFYSSACTVNSLAAAHILW
jgi:hypothetical protein